MNNNGYKTLSDTLCNNAHMPAVGQLIKTLDGGYAFTENTLVNGRFQTGLVKLAGDGAHDWHWKMENVLGNLLLSGLMQTASGDFYLMGAVARPEPVKELWPQPMENSPGYPAIVKVSPHGQRLPFRVQSVLTPISDGRITFGIEVADGLVFMGLKRKELPHVDGLGRYKKAYAPWIFKIDHQGAMVWEHALQTDDEKLIQDPETVYSSFARPLAEASGNIVVSTTVSNLYFNPQTKLYEPMTRAAEQDPHTIIIRFSNDGRELARERLSKCGVITLLNSPGGGFELFGAPGSSANKGIYHAFLGDDLRVKSQKFVPVEDFNAFAVAPASISGEFHVFGNAMADGSNRTNATLIYLDRADHVTRQISYGRETYPCAMVVGNSPNEVALVYQAQGTAGDAHFARIAGAG
jgi:hypothetical protein